jgi:hypothetical protein
MEVRGLCNKGQVEAKAAHCTKTEDQWDPAAAKAHAKGALKEFTEEQGVIQQQSFLESSI